MGAEKDTRILEAATAVFFRYGYKRTTMGDLAKAAGLSRPALYLRFCNKERIFEAACRQIMARSLGEIEVGMASLETPLEKLRLAFELWAVRPFALIVDAPDARDLFECSLAFAKETVDRSTEAFEAQLAAVLASSGPPDPGPRELAHLLATAVHGFKTAARSCEELRGMIEGLLKVVLAPRLKP